MDETFQILKAAAAIIDPGFGDWAYDMWEAHNNAYFNGTLQTCPILWELTAHGKDFGHFDSDLRRITLHTSLVRPSGANPWGKREVIGKRLASDVLLHEMIHQHIWQQYGNGGGGISSHNCDAWVSEINRLSPLLGLDCKATVIRQARVSGRVEWIVPEGYLSRVELAGWPFSVRDSDYYEEDAWALLKVKPK